MPWPRGRYAAARFTVAAPPALLLPLASTRKTLNAIYSSETGGSAPRTPRPAGGPSGGRCAAPLRGLSAWAGT